MGVFSHDFPPIPNCPRTHSSFDFSNSLWHMMIWLLWATHSKTTRFDSFPRKFSFPGKSKNSSRYRRFLLLSYPSPSLFALQFLGFAFAPFCFPRTESWFAPGTVFLCITLYVSFVSYVEKEMMIFYHFGVSMSAYGWDVGFYFLAVS